MLEFLKTVGHIIDHNLTVSEYMAQFFRDYVINNVSDSTQKRYAEFIDLHIIPGIGDLKLRALKAAHIQSFYSSSRDKRKFSYKNVKGKIEKVFSDKKISSTTILHIHRLLHLALKYAVQWGYIQSNPADYVKAPSAAKTKIVIYTEDEINTLLEAIKGSALFMSVFIAYVSGMRLGEVYGLQESDVDMIKKQFVVRYSYRRINGNLVLKDPKTKGSSRNVPFLPGTFQALEKYIFTKKENRLKYGSFYNNNDFFLKWEDGRPLSPNYISTKLKEVIKRLGLNSSLNFHALRHTHASWLLKQGVHPKIVSERLGHSNVNITLNTYSHLLPNLQKDVISNLKNPLSGTF